MKISAVQNNKIENGLVGLTDVSQGLLAAVHCPQNQ